jgi:hypothetical protein
MAGIFDISINKTMMRVDLPMPLKTGEKYTFSVKWYYNINDRMKVGGRSGMEYFPDDDNYLYTIAQFFPRMAVYDDINGWQNKQFLGRGEFALPFGDYKVKITVPADHIVGSTGQLQNPKEVLTDQQIALLNKAKTSDVPVIIVSQAEAEKKEKEKSQEKKVWEYHAVNVRDFAFASSRKLIWDAMGAKFWRPHSIGHVVLPKGRQSALGNVLDKSSGSNAQNLFEIYDRLSLSGGDLGAYQSHWHGVSHDLL